MTLGYHVFLAVWLVGDVEGLSESDCRSINVPLVPGPKMPMYTVRYGDDEKECIVECDPFVNGTLHGGCLALFDALVSAMTRAGLVSEAACQRTMIEAPGKQPKTTDPEMLVMSCPEWLVYSGFDRGVKRTNKFIRTEVALTSLKSLNAFKAAAASQFSTVHLISRDADAGLSEDDCKSIHIPAGTDSGLPMFSVRYSDENKQCTVECDPVVNGSLILGCVAFPDGVIEAMDKAGLQPASSCQHTIIEVPDKAPNTTDPEMSINSCPEWFLYSGWDRGVERTVQNERTEMVLKSATALKTFKAMLVSSVNEFSTHIIV